MCCNKIFLDSRLNVYVVPPDHQIWYSCHISRNLFKYIIGATFHGAEVLLVFMKISYLVQRVMKEKPDTSLQRCEIIMLSLRPKEIARFSLGTKW